MASKVDFAVAPGRSVAGTLPPGSFGSAPGTEAKEFIADPIGFLWDRYRKYGPIFKTNLGGPIVFMVGPEANRFVLRDHTEHFSWAQGWPKYVKLLWGEDVLVMKDGENHTHLRQMLAPVFAHDSLVQAFNYAWDAAPEFVDGWRAAGPMPLWEESKRVVFEWIYSWMAGDIRGNVEKRRFAKRLFDTFTAIPEMRHTGAGASDPDDEEFVKLRKQKAYARHLLTQHFQNLAERSRNEPNATGISLLAQHVGKQGDRLTNKQIADHALLFLVTGGDATANFLVWFVHDMARHPEVRDKLRAEIDSVVGKDDITAQHLRRLPYLAAVMQEVERVHPPLGGVRKVVSPFTYNGYTVPAGWSLRMAAVVSHHLPEVFADPQRFEPERFLPPRDEEKKSPYSLIGFGAGHRQCTGKPLALYCLQAMAARMVRDYDWTLPEPQDLSPVLYNRAVFLPKDRLKVGFSKRSSSA